MDPEMWTCVDAEMRPRIPTQTSQADAIAAGQAALLLVDDTSWGVVQILSGKPLGSEGYDSLTADQFFNGGFFFPPLNQVVPLNFNRDQFPAPYRYIKVGEIRFVGSGTVTFFPLTTPDGQKREDT